LEEGLWKLTTDNFAVVTHKGYVFVKFFAPWCPHCQRLGPTWKALAKEFENIDGIKIAEVGRYTSLPYNRIFALLHLNTP
jgi:thiol-disulfide isomerase/thioredoxin